MPETQYVPGRHLVQVETPASEKYPLEQRFLVPVRVQLYLSSQVVQLVEAPPVE